MHNDGHRAGSSRRIRLSVLAALALPGLAEAFRDPVYQLMPDRPVAGQSLLVSMARSLGVDKFEGWSRLMDDGDAEIDALKVQGF